MALSRVFFSDLRSGCCSPAVEVRLLRFWEARNPRRGGEMMWIDMLLVDVNATIMQATINASRVGAFRPKLTTACLLNLYKTDVSVALSLFDAEAVDFHQKLDRMLIDPKVIVATSINPKMVGGRLFLNATSGTHIYFDKETTAGETFFYRLVARDTGLPPAAPLLKGYAKVESLTIAELNSFIITAPSQCVG
ncbi:unnamed protein product [Eruca vesicaria subsp. sativa]|uniref:Uncharacterized protein n=1 Tax=Eruca vesicaria subsp. sativa TaxID=29727 RepID=A0ABC8JJD2_ERUVS|nr:unnamed protein product [Eruca vesicaria subsp. sativa]